MGKLEQRKFTLDGFSNLMAMFREIESIQEELKEVEVRSGECEKILLIALHMGESFQDYSCIQDFEADFL